MTTEFDELRDHLNGLLQAGIVEVVFTKKDGTIREMLCTLQADHLPPLVEGKEKKERKVNPDIMSVYDIDAKGWRSFRLDSILEVNENVKID